MNVPIIGQPKLVGWYMTFVLRCTCGEGTVMLVGTPGLATAPCPSCGTLYRLMGMPSVTPDGQVNLPLGTARPAKGPEDQTPITTKETP